MQDKLPDILEPIDRSEFVSLMEPMLIAEGSHHRHELTELALELVARSSGFSRSLPEGLCASLADLVRSMNCYYSNLIEGHNTHPVDIDRALKQQYDSDPGRRSLQKEALAHISVQKWIDEGGLKGRVFFVESIQEVHRRFCDLLPEELLQVEKKMTGERLQVIGGEFRQQDVQVGLHVPVSPGSVPRFLARYQEVYSGLGKAASIVAAAAAHHRLLWIHPFLDGNGRVARLISHAGLLECLDTRGLWSVARGLARNVTEYKNHLALCDLVRRNDLDGRGNLSEEELAAFTRFFLKTCLDQVNFMAELMKPERLRARIQLWTEEEIRLKNLPHHAGRVMDALLYRGEVPRNEVAEILGVGERHARRTMQTLIERDIVQVSGARDPYRLVFSAAHAARWLPGLFPDVG